MKSDIFWLDYSKKDEWADWLSKLPAGKQDVYWNPDYARLYAKDDASANCYIYASGDETYLYPFIMHPLPRMSEYFDIITPYGYGGPIASTDDVCFLKEAYGRFNEEAMRRNVVAEVIKFHPLLANNMLVKDIYGGEIKPMCPVVHADMDVDEKYRWEKIYSHANRKKINKASKNNITFSIGQSEETWKAFKALYNETMEANKAGKFYYFSEEYFDNIRTKLSGQYILASCIIDKKIVSVVLMLLGKRFAYFHLSGTDRNYMTFGVNNFLYHEIILWCKEKRYEKLLMGGGRGDGEDDPLFQFKKNFSDKVDSFYVGENILNRVIYDKACVDWANMNAGKDVPNRLLKYRL